MKLFRRLEEGPNPDVEICEQLTRRTPFRRVPRVAASLVYEPAGERVAHLAMAQELVNSQSDGWTHALGELGRYYEEAPQRDAPGAELLPDAQVLELAARPTPQAICELAGGYIDSAQLLGRRTAELHAALASDTAAPTFVPEPLTKEDVAQIAAQTIGQARRARALLDLRFESLPPEIAATARDTVASAEAAVQRLQRARSIDAAAMRIRIHGDFHLGQVLWSEGDFYIIDFEGEPARPLDDRRLKQSPLKDAAAMLRSFSYAAYAALFAQTSTPAEFDRLEPWSRVWQIWSGAAFLRGYLSVDAVLPLLPSDAEQRRLLLDLFRLDKGFYELEYELNNRPDWTRIPLRGLQTMVL
jgi:trehalose synthase-fused probable maltokinase